MFAEIENLQCISLKKLYGQFVAPKIHKLLRESVQTPHLSPLMPNHYLSSTPIINPNTLIIASTSSLLSTLTILTAVPRKSSTLTSSCNLSS